MNARVTQADVARKLGVHSTTVSLALRNSPSIALATRQRIQQAAAELGYHPDPALSALMAYRSQTMPNRRTQTVAYVTNWQTRWGWQAMSAHADFFIGAQRKATALGYQLEHFWLGEREMSAARLNKIFFHRNICGVLFASHHLVPEDGYDFDWTRLSAVKIDCHPRTLPLNSVTNHQVALIRFAVQKAAAAGYRRIGLAMPKWWDDYVDLGWSSGFLAEQSRLPRDERVPICLLPQPANTVPVADARLAGPETTQCLRLWMEQHKPDVIISHLPFVEEAFRELRVRLPADVAYIDLFVLSNDGRIAGVQQNCQRVGEIAMEQLASQLQFNQLGLPDAPTATYVKGGWVDGISLPPVEAGSWESTSGVSVDNDNPHPVLA